MHLWQMTDLIVELSVVGHVLTNEQKVQVVIYSLTSSWNVRKTTLTHNTFIYTEWHLEL